MGSKNSEQQEYNANPFRNIVPPSNRAQNGENSERREESGSHYVQRQVYCPGRITEIPERHVTFIADNWPTSSRIRSYSLLQVTDSSCNDSLFAPPRGFDLPTFGFDVEDEAGHGRSNSSPSYRSENRSSNRTSACSGDGQKRKKSGGKRNYSRSDSSREHNRGSGRNQQTRHRACTSSHTSFCSSDSNSTMYCIASDSPSTGSRRIPYSDNSASTYTIAYKSVSSSTLTPSSSQTLVTGTQSPHKMFPEPMYNTGRTCLTIGQRVARRGRRRPRLCSLECLMCRDRSKLTRLASTLENLHNASKNFCSVMERSRSRHRSIHAVTPKQDSLVLIRKQLLKEKKTAAPIRKEQASGIIMKMANRGVKRQRKNTDIRHIGGVGGVRKRVPGEKNTFTIKTRRSKRLAELIKQPLYC